MTQERGPGDLIDGRFRLIERLGSGAMGAVWRALDEVLQREVALKEVKPADPGLATDPEFAEMLRTRVLREAQALARIDHPHVVTIHHIVDLPGEVHPWLVMELVRGGTLEDRLACGPLRPDEVAELGRGLLGALRAAHAAGICHRDVKPANVLLRPDGSPVLTDFGIADLADTSRLTMTGGLTGSPAYIAPERLYGSEGNPASDLWSLGMLLYVAVEGNHPLRRATAAATLAAVMSGVVPAATRAGALDPALRAVLVADPARRANAEQLDALLVRALQLPPAGLVVASPLPYPTSAGSPYPVAASAGSPAVQSLPGGGQGSATNQLWPQVPPKEPASTKRRSGVGVSVAIGALILALIAGAALIGNAVVPWFRQQALSAEQRPEWSPSADDEPVDPPADRPTKEAAKPTPRDSPEAAKTVSLHTEKGMEQAIRALKKKAGTTRFSRVVVYPDYAVADVPVKGRKGAIDRYSYRDGVAEQSTSSNAGREVKAVDAARIDWSILPSLMKQANNRLNLKKPENRYLILDGTGIFTDGEPVIMVYLTDKYGGGYLTADLDGTVIEVNPAQ
ncbi:serine/threonine-protein kinase [Microlunatus parietis]|uniref:non-specific serine/threonine protein kinase n=1 Tax=Microlunatus parietis TaxID=682979 RepID=A0A7Y9L9H0_9ACTN|nr:serine/threonine-protein kinase [Microlunatus parietis]NYE69572.1 serine/threonine protein kinase [Microlunatus parietis]